MYRWRIHNTFHLIWYESKGYSRGDEDLSSCQGKKFRNFVYFHLWLINLLVWFLYNIYAIAPLLYSCPFFRGFFVFLESRWVPLGVCALMADVYFSVSPTAQNPYEKMRKKNPLNFWLHPRQCLDFRLITVVINYR